MEDDNLKSELERLKSENARLKDTDENYLAVWQARETVENGLRLGAVGNLISTTGANVVAPSASRLAGRAACRSMASVAFPSRSIRSSGQSCLP